MTQTFNRLQLLGLLATTVSTLALGWTLPVRAQAYPPSSLQPSDQGDSVAELQENLARLGYYNASVTGDFDAATQAAVIQFQQANGLTADGIVGTATQAALTGGAAESPTASAETGAADAGSVSALQQQLTQLGYYSGAINGAFDATTQAAVTSFQRDQGLAVDGIVGSATESALNQAAQASATAAPATTYSAVSADGLLQLGDTGAEVTNLQSQLQTLGYYNGPISGSFGSQTQEALTAFQQAQGLTADGIAGPQVDTALASAAVPAVQPAVAPASLPQVSPQVLPQTVPQTVPQSIPQIPAQTAVAPAAMPFPGASVQVPGLPPAIPEATPVQAQSPARSSPAESDRFSVMELQRRLQLNGFDPAEMTGEYDFATQNAVNQAQQSYGLSPQDFGN